MRRDRTLIGALIAALSLPRLWYMAYSYAISPLGEPRHLLVGLRRLSLVLLSVSVMWCLAAGTTAGSANAADWQISAGTPSPGVAPTTPALPAPLLLWPPDGGARGTARPTFKWSAASGRGISYRIMVATSPDALPADATSDSCAGCAVNDTTSETTYTPAAGVLHYSTTYYWSVAARSATLRSGWSRTAHFSTQVVDLPAPTLLSPADGTTGQSVGLTFSWSVVPRAERGYRILVATSLDALPLDPVVDTCSSCVIDDTSTGTSYQPAVGLLRATTQYYWQVQARSLTTPGMWSGPAAFSTQMTELP